MKIRILISLVASTLVSMRAEAVPNDSITTGIRVGALVGQKRLASAPFATLDKLDQHHITIHLSHIEGKIEGSANSSQYGAGYVGKAPSNAVGLGYTSASNGYMSMFCFVTYSLGSADSHEINNWWRISNSRTEASASGVGLNLMLLGGPKSVFAMGLFGAGLGLLTKSRYDFHNSKDPVNPNLKVRGMSIKWGPTVGLQAKFRPTRFFSLRGYSMYYRDLSDRCVSYTIEGQDSGCVGTLNNSFAAVGTSIAVWRFSLSLYSQIWSKIGHSDVRIRNYQLGYSYGF